MSQILLMFLKRYGSPISLEGGGGGGAGAGTAYGVLRRAGSVATGIRAGTASTAPVLSELGLLPPSDTATAAAQSTRKRYTMVLVPAQGAAPTQGGRVSVDGESYAITEAQAIKLGGELFYHHLTLEKEEKQTA